MNLQLIIESDTTLAEETWSEIRDDIQSYLANRPTSVEDGMFVYYAFEDASEEDH